MSGPLTQSLSREQSATTAMPIRVLVVDDSAVVRQLLCRELANDPSITVVGTAADPYAARDKLVQLRPDVMTLDVEMPRMDGISFLRKIMQMMPMPVIILSSLAVEGSQTVLDALRAGAVDVVAKPGSSHSVDNLGPVLIERIKMAATAHAAPARSAPAAKTAAGYRAKAETIFAIGASTGGVQALTTLISMLPENAPGTVIVQHMPPKFTKSFADRLNSDCAVEVKEAVDGDAVEPLSSTVGSEAWNSRDLKSRPH